MQHIYIAFLLVTLSACGGSNGNDDSESDSAPIVIDTDGDGVGDISDAFPGDPTETTDTDNDGVGDNSDAFPSDPTETTDTDGDGVGDNSDAFPNDPTETTDTDGDGVGDNSDAFPNDPEKWEPQVSRMPNLPNEYFNYADIELPEHLLNNFFPEEFGFQVSASSIDNTPLHNPVTNAGATLGRVLFYETQLSANNSISCGSCHKQSLGFTDDHKFSEGFEGELTRRHSMTLANARFYDSGKFFWDERADTLEQQVLMPIQDPIEMGLTLSELEEKISNLDYYPALFQAAFGDEMITVDRISLAMAQFIRSMVSVDSKYARHREAVNSPFEPFVGFTDEENLGKSLFMNFRGDIPPCAGCHTTEAFVGPFIDEALTSASNNGINAESGDDLGVFETTGDPNHEGKFKIPTLINIFESTPYMHDGRFSTLEEVVEHYSTGIQDHPTLSRILRERQEGSPVSYNFSEEEKSALVSFLKTLSDESLLTDKKFSDPFVN